MNSEFSTFIFKTMSLGLFGFVICAQDIPGKHNPVLGIPRGVVIQASPPPPRPKVRQHPEGLLMMVEGWCPDGNCVLAQFSGDMIIHYPNPTKFAYKRITFVTEAEAAKLSYYGQSRKNKLPSGEVKIEYYGRDYGSEAGFSFIKNNPMGKLDYNSSVSLDKNGGYVLEPLTENNPSSNIKINVRTWIKVLDSGYFVPMPITENLVGYEMHWTPARRHPTKPRIENPARVENFPDDGIAVGFEARQEKDTLIWKINDATHGMSALVSQDGGRTWTSIYKPEYRHEWERVSKEDHTATRTYRWKQDDSRYPPTVSEDGGKSWHDIKWRSETDLSTDGGITWHPRFNAMVECPGKEHAYDLQQLSSSTGVPLRFLFQGTRGMRVFWRIFEVGKGWSNE